MESLTLLPESQHLLLLRKLRKETGPAAIYHSLHYDRYLDITQEKSKLPALVTDLDPKLFSHAELWKTGLKLHAQEQYLEALALLNEVDSSLFEIQDQFYLHCDRIAAAANADKSSEAQKLIDEAWQLVPTLEKKQSIAKAVLKARMGFLYFKNEDFKASSLHLLEAILLFENIEALHIQDIEVWGNAYLHLGIMNANTGDFETARNYFEKAEALSEKWKVSRVRCNAILTKGLLFGADLDNSKACFEKVLTLAKKGSSIYAHALSNLAICHFQSGDTATAIKLLNTTYKFYHSQSKDFAAMCRVCMQRSNIYQSTQKRSLAIRELNKAAQLIDNIKILRSRAHMKFAIAEAYQNLGKSKPANEFLKQAFIDLQEAQQTQNDSKIELLQFNYQKAMLESEANRLRQQTALLQQQILRSQMNPHFMKNALNAIQSRVISGNHQAAGAMLSKFSEMLESLLTISEKEWVVLEKELLFLKEYLNINSELRFSTGAFTYDIVADDDELEEDIMMVPAMAIQPFIENAIEHGIRPNNKGHIDIHLSVIDDDTIRCTITDNGIGRKAAEKSKRSKESNGLRITKSRLQMLQNLDANAEIFSIIDLYDPETKQASGTKVVLYLPVKYK